MGLPQRDQESDHVVNNLETAHLALQGALANVRALQDINLDLKAEVQEFRNREKAAKQRFDEMQGQLADLHARWQASQRTQEQYHQELSEKVRSEVAIQEQEKLVDNT